MVHINKPINNITGGVVSEGDPPVKRARQTTSVPLYTDMAGMVSVSTNVPSLSLIEPTLTSGYTELRLPLINQLMMASCRSWRHRNKTFWFSDALIITDEEVSAKPDKNKIIQSNNCVSGLDIFGFTCHRGDNSFQ